MSAILAATKKLALIKPERQLGAVWTSDKVARRKVVLMCESCWRKYSPWWRKAEYQPDWGWRWISDCDGCGTPGVFCSMFLPEENFHQALGPNHGIYPKP